ncbi:MAG: carboxy-S-adenosyl-L-methionine synthase CmoA [Pseudomonadales bacterium]|nr:carboxy-S-adenosyl-L-methionine synthase CmoA [Pseudomonadales bacterium]
MKKDTVYAAPRRIEAFEFDERVADVFENMIRRSVPGYALVLELLGVITEQYGRPRTNCYDLGCSLGASTLVMRRHLPASCRVIGVDNSPAMADRCRANVARDHSAADVEIRCEAMQDTTIDNASVVAMNFTLQFIPPAERYDMLARIARGMVPGGALVLSEKVCFDDNETQHAMTDLHHRFKRHQGYSDLEIAQKRAALENVLVPETAAAHIDRLHAAGFSEVHEIERCLSFSSFLAIRQEQA